MRKDKQKGSVQFNMRFNLITDADIVAVLEGEDIPSHYIKQAIREKIANDEKAYREFMEKDIPD